MAKKRLVVIDGKSIFYRGYYAMPNLSNRAGLPTGGIYGFARMALKVIAELEPDYVAVAWDKSKTAIRSRRKLYPEYKAQRKPMPQEMRTQIPYLRDLLEAFGWPLLELDDYEADDIMGALALQAKEAKMEAIMVTGDLDIVQLVNSHVKAMILRRGISDYDLYDAEMLKERYGLKPEQFDDFKALKGDASDNIPGVKGVGEKTARDLIQKYGDLETIYEHLDEIKGALREKLEKDKEMAFLSRELVRIKIEAPVKLKAAAADGRSSDPGRIRQLFQELQFRQLLAELPAHMQSEQSLFATDSTPDQPKSELKTPKVVKVETIAELEQLKPTKQLLIHAFSELNFDTRLPEAQALLLSWDEGRCYWLDFAVLPSVKVKRWLKEHGQKCQLIGYNLKQTLKSGFIEEFTESEIACDIAVAAFVLNPLIRQQALAQLAFNELGVGEAVDSERFVSADNAAQLCALIWQLSALYQGRLKKLPRLAQLARTLEYPLIKVLSRLEERGLKLDTAHLKQLSQDFAERITAAEQAIFDLAKSEFNVASPQQLQTVLFDKLGLPTKDIKKTKSGYSTAASELDKLRGIHPIIDYISEYRELAKLKSTYIDALPQLVDTRGRLHTTLNQTVTQTGRLSSDNPNLQNIPIRTEVGRSIRRAFIAERGNRLISADYSQFELRLAAVLSKDKAMLKVFNEDQDIHAQTAAEVYGVPLDKVTKAQRYHAKAVNFGVMYGMSPHGLARTTGMSYQAAKEFIERYFGLRQDLLQYLEGLKQQAKRDGYVETLFGRRRPMPDITSSNWMVRKAAERAAINMPIQGTEADLMKLAMLEIESELDVNPGMLLQIHDSILLECPAQAVEATTKRLKAIMEGIAEHPQCPQAISQVKLTVDVTSGKTWAEL